LAWLHTEVVYQYRRARLMFLAGDLSWLVASP